MYTPPLFDKILSGSATENEKKEFNDWLAHSETNRSEFEDVKLLWEKTNESSRSPIKIESQDQDGLNKIRTLVQVRLRQRNRNKKLMSLAAIFLAVAISLACIFFLYDQRLGPQGYLKFNGTSLEQVILVLEDEYHVNITVKEKRITSCMFTGAFYQAEDVNEVLRTLSEALDLEHQIVGNGEYLLTGSGCAR